MKTFEYWLTKDGTKIKFVDLTDTHFKNVVVFVHSHPMLSPFIPTVQGECKKRGLSLSDILNKGYQAYKDSQGLTRLWDAETNTEMVEN